MIAKHHLMAACRSSLNASPRGPGVEGELAQSLMTDSAVWTVDSLAANWPSDSAPSFQRARIEARLVLTFPIRAMIDAQVEIAPKMERGSIVQRAPSSSEVDE